MTEVKEGRVNTADAEDHRRAGESVGLKLFLRDRVRTGRGLDPGIRAHLIVL